MSAKIQFSWSKPADGFEWLEGYSYPNETTNERIKTDYLVRKGTGFKTLTPLEDPGLFLTFSNVAPKNHEEVRIFANRYGLLGMPQAVEVAGKDKWGEHIGSWATEIYAMRSAVTTWMAFQAGDEKRLAGLITWRREQTKGICAMFGDENCGFLISPNSEDSGLQSRLVEGDLLQAAAAAVNLMINRKLKEHAVVSQLIYRTRGFPSVLLTPSNLIAAIWAQFAYAVEGGRTYYQCEVCRNWIEAGAPNTSRTDKRFCTPTCKSRAHKEKQKRAAQLHREGISTTEIALALSTDVETVKGWIK